jgi:hypothetical protein
MAPWNLLSPENGRRVHFGTESSLTYRRLNHITIIGCSEDDPDGRQIDAGH